MDVLIPDWSEQNTDKGYEVRTTLITSAKVGQSMNTVLDLANRRTAGSRPPESRQARRHRGRRPAIR